ncbi:hypothetical protein Tco_1576866 [Tanacetum coccineum]
MFYLDYNHFQTLHHTKGFFMGHSTVKHYLLALVEPIAPPSSDYVPGPEHPPSPDYVLGPEHPPLHAEVPYVPEPKYPEYLVPSDDEAPWEDQPLPTDASPIALSPGYVADSDSEEDSKEDTEEDHADYPTNRGGDNDEPSDDDDDDDDTDDEDEDPFEDEDDDDEEEEHLAPADAPAPLFCYTHCRPCSLSWGYRGI